MFVVFLQIVFHNYTYSYHTEGAKGL